MKRILSAAVITLFLVSCSSDTDTAPVVTEVVVETTEAVAETTEVPVETTEATTTTEQVTTTTVDPNLPNGDNYNVTRVIDGDTVEVKKGKYTYTIRIIGIDTPEKGVCGASEATAFVTNNTRNKKVTVTPDEGDNQDKYGRYLRYIEIDDVDLGLSVIESGLAVARYDSRDGYDRHRREDEYRDMDIFVPDFSCQPAATVAPAPQQPAPVVTQAPAPAVTAAPAPPPPPPPPPPSNNGPFKNCTEVRAAGRAPIRVGEPGWDPKFDRDGDGVGCE